MELRLRATIGAVAWAMMIGVAAAQKVPGLPAGTQLNPGGVKAGGGNYIVIGCVSREGQGFVVTDSRANPPAQYRLDGDQDLLRIHVGHTVEIGGPITPATGNMKPGLKVASLSYIATTCQKVANVRP